MREQMIKLYPETIGFKGFNTVLRAIELIDTMKITDIYKKLATEQNISSQGVSHNINTVKLYTKYGYMTNKRFILLLKEELNNEI